jgi:hypothetical protein
MEQLTTLYIDKESHKFSAAHFTIFSATERERLHGHNYSVSARIVAPMGDNGFSADYNVYKTRLARLCDELDEYMLLAGDSPYQTIEEAGACYRVTFVLPLPPAAPGRPLRRRRPAGNRTVRGLRSRPEGLYHLAQGMINGVPSGYWFFVIWHDVPWSDGEAPRGFRRPR